MVSSPETRADDRRRIRTGGLIMSMRNRLPNRRPAITFTFEQPIPGAYVHLVAKAPDSPDWTEGLRFSPRREQLEKEVKVTFVGGKER